MEKSKFGPKDYFRFTEHFNNDFASIEEIPYKLAIPEYNQCQSSEGSLSDYDDNGLELLDIEFEDPNNEIHAEYVEMAKQHNSEPPSTFAENKNHLVLKNDFIQN